MPTDKQRREAARRHLERQQARRQERAARRQKITVIATIVGLVIVAAVVAVVVKAVHHDDSNTASASTSASPTASPSVSSTAAAEPSRKATPIAARAAKSTSGPCGYKENASTLTAGNLFDVGLPPDPKPTPTKTEVATFNTNQGTITVTLDGASAPCNVQSIEYLISKKFYDQTPCPRLVDSGIFVIQCGDPSGTKSGGPTYTTKDENLTKVNYTAGTVAMANAGANTNGSQFFFITKDSNTGLGKSYSVIGHVTGGMDVLDKVAAGGEDGSTGTGDGAPKIPFYFKTVTVKA